MIAAIELSRAYGRVSDRESVSTASEPRTGISRVQTYNDTPIQHDNLYPLRHSQKHASTLDTSAFSNLDVDASSKVDMKDVHVARGCRRWPMGPVLVFGHKSSRSQLHTVANDSCLSHLYCTHPHNMSSLGALWTIAHSALYGFHIASLNGVQEAVICGDQAGVGGGRKTMGFRHCLDLTVSVLMYNGPV